MADQRVGEPVPNWVVPARPPRQVMRGQLCSLEPLDRARHGRQLWNAFSLDAEQRSWTYLSQGPYESFDAFDEWIERVQAADDPLFFAITVAPHGAVGVAAYLRITPDAGTIEVGHIHMSPLLQRTAAATEAMYLMMREAFALGYRRYEWKCDSLNAASRAAAERLGFTFEGIFRQALVYKGRNRDTAWFSIIDREWPALRDAYEQWLAPANFDAAGRQRARLSELVSSARMARNRA
jgi:RimJ/RimL family protein N-acetyltransferase